MICLAKRQLMGSETLTDQISSGRVALRKEG
ncbi:hypothetical protein QFZ54_003159 [Sphingomonas faeni]|nr:hypothetical protein [Sphingomonas faeni]